MLTRYFEIAHERHRALRRHGREVHRRRGHGRVGHAGRARGRCRARGPRRASSWSTRSAALGAGHRGARGRPHRRGGGDDRRDRPGHGRRRPRQHGRPAAVGRAAGRRPGRRGDDARGERRDRVRAGRRQELKGKAAPGRGLARAAGRRAAARRRDARTLPEPPFVGRDEELRLLRDAASTTTGRDRRPRLVSITGPAGIGKSRLAWELEKYIDGIVENDLLAPRPIPGVRRGHHVLGAGRDGAPAGRAGRGRRRGDDAGAGSRDIGGGVRARRRWTRRWVEPALLALLGVEPAPAGGREALFAAWRIFFERIAAAGHHGPRVRGPPLGRQRDCSTSSTTSSSGRRACRCWSSPSPGPSCSTGGRTGERARGTSRRWRSSRCSPTAMRELLAGFVPGLPRAAVEAIVGRADGIPLYAVETVRMLVAEGRLERVDGAYRPNGRPGRPRHPGDAALAHRVAAGRASTPTIAALLQDAAVLGQTFTPAALAAVSGRSADELEPRLRGARPARAARARGGPAVAGARPVRLRPVADPRSRLRHAGPARATSAAPGRGALLRVAR